MDEEGLMLLYLKLYAQVRLVNMDKTKERARVKKYRPLSARFAFKTGRFDFRFSSLKEI